MSGLKVPPLTPPEPAPVIDLVKQGLRGAIPRGNSPDTLLRVIEDLDTAGAKMSANGSTLMTHSGQDSLAEAYPRALHAMMLLRAHCEESREGWMVYAQMVDVVQAIRRLLSERELRGEG